MDVLGGYERRRECGREQRVRNAGAGRGVPRQSWWLPLRRAAGGSSGRGRAKTTRAWLIEAAGGLWAAAALPPERAVRQAIAAVLSRPEYQACAPRLPQRWSAALLSLLDRLLRWLLRPLEWVVERLEGARGEAVPLVRWLVGGLLTLVLVLVLLHLYYMAISAFRAGGQKRGGRAGAAADLRADPAVLLAQAQAAAAQGHYRQALRLLYQATLLRLDRAGLVVCHPARTNWDYAQALAGHAHLAEPFHTLTLIVDRALYAAAPVAGEDFARAQQASKAVEAALQ
jgi:tetratricopeptide (TPR) repeat protein